MWHIVQKGEHLSGIAAKCGFADWSAIWMHPTNARLREARKDPNVLFPSDRIYIPEKSEKTAEARTGQRHVFETKRPKVLLNLKIGKEVFAAGKQPGRVHIADKEKAITSCDGAVFEEEIPVLAESAALVVGERIVRLEIGHLDPVETESGQLARLKNLGYLDFEAGFVDSEVVAAAILVFQRDQGLVPDGICGQKTQAALKAVYGC